MFLSLLRPSLVSAHFLEIGFYDSSIPILRARSIQGSRFGVKTKKKGRGRKKLECRQLCGKREGLPNWVIDKQKSSTSRHGVFSVYHGANNHGKRKRETCIA